MLGDVSISALPLLGLFSLVVLLLNWRSPGRSVANLVAQIIICLLVTMVGLMTACAAILSKRWAIGARLCNAVAARAKIFMGAMIGGEMELVWSPAGYAVLKPVRGT
jgi:hypothetical protein